MCTPSCLFKSSLVGALSTNVGGVVDREELPRYPVTNHSSIPSMPNDQPKSLRDAICALVTVLYLFLAAEGTRAASLELQWTRRFLTGFYPNTLVDMAIDGQGNLVATGDLNGDAVTVRYSAAGGLLWSNRFNAAFPLQTLRLAQDGQGRIWLAGSAARSEDIFGPKAAFIRQYGPNGDLAWSTQLHTNAETATLTLNRAGEAYLTAALRAPGAQESSIVVTKLGTDGVQQWQREIANGGPLSSVQVVLDSSDHLLLLWARYALGSPSYTISRIDPGGNVLWSQVSAASPSGASPQLTPAEAGGFYLTDDKLIVSRLNGQGERQWSVPLGDSPRDFGSRAALDPSGNVLVVGSSATTVKLCTDCGDVAVLYRLSLNKVSPEGVRLGGTSFYPDYGFGTIRFDPDASVYLAGNYSSYSDEDAVRKTGILLVKQSPDGTELWRTNFNSVRLAGLEVDPTGNVYLAMAGPSVVELKKFAQPRGRPLLTAQPIPLGVLEGDEATFSVQATGFPSPTFQWSRNGEILPGATNGTLRLPAVSIEEAGDYSVRLLNELGEATSTAARLTVNRQLPTVLAAITSGVSPALVGDSVMICATSTGGPKPSLQWRYNDADLIGETNACLKLDSIRLTQIGRYTVIASNLLGTAASTVRVDVTPVRLTSTTPTNTSVMVGQCFTANAIVREPPFTLQWEANGFSLLGETNVSLRVCPSAPDQITTYRLVVNNAFGSYTSAPIVLSVFYEPATAGSITLQNGDSPILLGEDVRLQATFQGSPPLRVQWRLNGADIIGATNHILPLLSVAPHQAGDYSFVVGNLTREALSPPFPLSVQGLEPHFVTPPSTEISAIEGLDAQIQLLGRGGPAPAYFLERGGRRVLVPLTSQPCCGLAAKNLELLDLTPADAGDYLIIASNSLGSVTSSIVSLTVAPATGLDRWTQRNPLPQSHPLLGMAWGNGLFVAVGAHGTVLTSPDGATWSAQPRRVTSQLNAVAFGGGVWLAVGEDGLILSSVDATNWTYRFSATRSALNSVAYGDGAFVVVGRLAEGSTVVLRSTDGSGADWNRQLLYGMDAERSVTYANGAFLAGGSTSLARSLDGLNWTQTLRVGSQVEALVHAEGRTVAVGADGLVLMSADGVTWQPRNSGIKSRLLGVAYAAGRFTAIGVRGTLITSTDTVSWSRGVSGTPDRLEALVSGANVMVAAGENGTLLRSQDSLIWEKRNVGVTRDLDGLYSAQGQLVAVGKGGNILVSHDGIRYLSAVSGVTNDLHGVTWGGGLWVAVGEPGIVLTSSDGLRWVAYEAGGSSSLKDVIYDGERWIAVGTGGVIVHSRDGLQWSTTQVTPGFDLNGLAYGNGLYLVAGDGVNDQNGSLFTSTNGTDWVVAPFYPGKNLRGVTYFAPRFLIAANDGHVFFTTNGNDFQASVAFTGENLRAVAPAGRQWVVVGNGGYLASYVDEVPQVRPLRTWQNLHRIATLNGRLTVVGNGGVILNSGRYLAELEPPALSTPDWLIPVNAELGRSYQLESSFDLNSWKTVLTFTNSADRVILRDAGAAASGRQFYRLTTP